MPPVYAAPKTRRRHGAERLARRRRAPRSRSASTSSSDERRERQRADRRVGLVEAQIARVHERAGSARRSTMPDVVERREARGARDAKELPRAERARRWRGAPRAPRLRRARWRSRSGRRSTPNRTRRVSSDAHTSMISASFALISSSILWMKSSCSFCRSFSACFTSSSDTPSSFLSASRACVRA